MPRAQIGGELNINSRAAKRALDDFQRHAQTVANRVSAIKVKYGFDDAQARQALAHMDRVTNTGKWTDLNSKVQLAARGLDLAKKAANSLLGADVNYEGLVRGIAAASDGTETLQNQINELVKIAAQPGLNFDTAVRGAIKLQSLGYSAREAREFISNLGNEVARVGGTVDNMDGFLTQMAQTLSKGKVEIQDYKIMAEHIPGLMKTAQGLDRTNAKSFFGGLLERLKEMPRVVAGAQESLKNLEDQTKLVQAGISGGKVAGFVTSFADAVTGVMSGKDILGEGGVLDSLGQNLSDVKHGTGKKGSTPITKYERKPGEIEAQKAITEDRAEKEKQRIETHAKLELDRLNEISDKESALGQVKGDITDSQVEEFSRIYGLMDAMKELQDEGYTKQEAVTALLEDRVQILKESADLAEKLELSQERAAEFIRDQNHHARKNAREEKATGDVVSQKAERERIQLETLRARGHGKQADRMEKEKALADETKRFRKMGMSEEDARGLAEQQQQNSADEAYTARTGRRKIRGVKSKNLKTGIDGAFHSPRFNFGEFQDNGIPGFDEMTRQTRPSPLAKPGRHDRGNTNGKKNTSARSPESVLNTISNDIKASVASLGRITSLLLKANVKSVDVA